MMDYLGRLLKTYPSFTLGFVEDELPMDKGWAFHAQSMEMDGWLSFCGMKRKGLGYVGQEIERLMELAGKNG